MSTTINIKIKTSNGKECLLEGLNPDEVVENVQALVEVEIGVPMDQQKLVYQGKPLLSNLTLRAQGITANTTIHVGVGMNAPATPAPPAAGGGAPTAVGGSGSAALQNQIANLFGGAAGGAPQQQQQPAMTQQQALQQQVANLFAGGGGGAPLQPQPMLDPNDPEVQRRMLKEIEQRNLEENFTQAMEYTPEAFGRVVMLYVKSTVNKIPLTAFVDSGAQMTIMNEATAERCGLMRLLDRRFGGTAKGVGTSKILGRIHMAHVELAGVHIPMSITVLESQDMEFLIGLDQLRRHQMCIDLEKNCLRLQGKELPFLQETELPKHFRDNQDPNSPTGQTGPTFDREASADGTVTLGGGGTAPSTTSQAPVAAAGGGSSSSSTAAANLGPEKEEKIKNVMTVSGQARGVVVRALEACDWKEDLAMNMLFE